MSADAAGDEDEAVDEEAVDEDAAVDEDTVIDEDTAIDDDAVIDDDAAVDEERTDDDTLDDEDAVATRSPPMRTPSTRRRTRLRSRRHRRSVDVPRRPRRMHGAPATPQGRARLLRARPPSGPPDVAPVARRGHARGSDA